MPARLRSKTGFQPAPFLSKKRDSTKTKRDARLYFLPILFVISICAIHILLRDEPTSRSVEVSASTISSNLQDQLSKTYPDSSFANQSLESIQHLVPRHSHVSLSADRSNEVSQLDNAPTLHAIFVCHCCVDHIDQPLQSLVRQTFVPSKLTLIHECSSDQRNELRHAARHALADGNTEDASVGLFPELSDHQCSESSIQLCLLRYLAAAAETDHSNFAVLLTDKVILEPTALEKACLSLIIRPHVSSIQMLEYDLDSLSKAKQNDDPLLVRRILPNVTQQNDPIVPLPLVYNVTYFQAAFEDSFNISSEHELWMPLLKILTKGRLLKEGLFTLLQHNRPSSNHTNLLSLDNIDKERKFVPQPLFSNRAFYKWSSWQDEKEMYGNLLYDFNARIRRPVDLRPISLGNLPRKQDKHRILLVVPWMQMGGSEKCMLDVGKYLANKEWEITFVLTMPFWQEDRVGEVSLENEWIDRALEISSDTFELLALGPNHEEPRLLRYMIESRNPDFMLMANSRWTYEHSSFIRAISPTIVYADYNHMIHPSWKGGGLPRFGANNSRFLDLHLAASEDVAGSMRKWIDPNIMQENPDKVKACRIGTNPDLLYSGDKKTEVRMAMRQKMNISSTATVVLFAGRFVIDKGVDVAGAVVNRFREDPNLSDRTVFLFVGSGDQAHFITNLKRETKDGKQFVITKPPALGIEELRNYYAMSDVLLLPSINEGIALVIYEAMAAGLLVITTDVGGQRELVTKETGILLYNYPSLLNMTDATFSALKKVVENPQDYEQIVATGRDLVRTKYTTAKFTECVYDNLMRVWDTRVSQPAPVDPSLDPSNEKLVKRITGSIFTERHHGLWNRHLVQRKVESDVTIGIKTYVCDNSIRDQLMVLVRSIRVHYPFVRVILGNDGPMHVANESFVKDDIYTEEHNLPRDCGISYGRNYMVNRTNTKFFLLLDDDHLFDDTTNLTNLVHGLRRDKFDIVGLRIRNLPGIDELERVNIIIPRYIALIRKLERRRLTLCVWNENLGPSTFGITHPITVDVLHNAFMARTEVLRKHTWRNELKVNEHMSFFLDAKDAKLRVGYLPSVFVHHRPRDYSKCYYDVRFREDKYRNLLRYEDQFLWDIPCQTKFPEKVKKHIVKYELNEDDDKGYLDE